MRNRHSLRPRSWAGIISTLVAGAVVGCSPSDDGYPTDTTVAFATARGAQGPEGDAVMPPDRNPPPPNLPVSPIDDGAEATEDQLRPPEENDPEMPPDAVPPRETSRSPIDQLPPPSDPGTMMELYEPVQEPPVERDQPERVPAELYEAARTEGSIRVSVGLDVPDATPDELRALTDGRQEVMQMQERLYSDLSRARLSSRNLSGIRRFRVTAGMTMIVDEVGLRFLDGLGYVVSVRRDRALTIHLAESTQQVNVPGALAVGLSGNGNAVAVLDTGVESGHAFFGGRVVAEACFSQNQCPGGTAGPQIGAGTGAPCTTNGSCDHGTHVAGIAAGLGTTLSGVARGADIIAISVFSQLNNAAQCAPEAPPCIRAFSGDIVDGLDQVLLFNNNVNLDIAAANLSLGGGQFNGFCNNADINMTQAINNLRNVGVATVISSGNNGFNGSVGFPGCIENAITVGNVTDSDAVASSSNSGPQVDLMAPGTNIQSSVLGGAFGPKSGTSMAAPHVAGAFAVMRQRFPTETVQQIEQRLENTGVMVTDAAASMTRPRLRLPFGWMWRSGSGSGWIGLWNQDQSNDRYVVGDFDGDGSDDLLSIKDPWAHLHRYTGSGWQFLWGTNSGSIHWWNMSSADRYIAADFDGDGQDELLAIKDPWAHLMKFTGSGWQFMWGTGNGWLGLWNMDLSDRFVAGDLDGDGRDELLSIKDPWHHVHRFNGSGWSWLSGANNGWIGSWNIGSSDRYALADVDGNGRDELLSFKNPWHHVHRYSGGTWQWMSGTGSGTIASWNMGSGDRYLPIDATGSGAAELMCLKDPWAHLMRYTSWWNFQWGTGSGQFAFWYMNSPDRYYAGDFDGDGDEDLLSIKDPWHHISEWHD